MKTARSGVTSVLFALGLLVSPMQPAAPAGSPPSLVPFITRAAPAVVSILIPADAVDDGQERNDSDAHP